MQLLINQQHSFFPFEKNEEGYHGDVVMVVTPRYERVETSEPREKRTVYAKLSIDESFNERNNNPQWDREDEVHVYSGKEPVMKLPTLPEIRIRRVR
jgi:hypothetical protein